MCRNMIGFLNRSVGTHISDKQHSYMCKYAIAIKIPFAYISIWLFTMLQVQSNRSRHQVIPSFVVL